MHIVISLHLNNCTKMTKEEQNYGNKISDSLLNPRTGYFTLSLNIIWFSIVIYVSGRKIYFFFIFAQVTQGYIYA